MQIPSTIQSFSFGNEVVHAYVPSYTWVQEQYQQQKNTTLFPYWAKVWPAAKAMCTVIANEPSLVKNKTVLELAAGLALPSLLAAKFATSVIASDYIQDATDTMLQSVAINQLKNMHCCLMDWNNIDPDVKADVLLLSDINYDPKSFDILYNVLERFISNGTTILLSTPQRLAGKDFMSRLLQWRMKVYDIETVQENETAFISVWLLGNNQ